MEIHGIVQGSTKQMPISHGNMEPQVQCLVYVLLLMLFIEKNTSKLRALDAYTRARDKARLLFPPVYKKQMIAP